VTFDLGLLVHPDTVWVKFEGQGRSRSQEENKSSATAEMAEGG